MNFRKVILALAAGGFGLTGIASAQITCTGLSATTAFVHAEGTTEVIPVMTTNSCAVGATTPSTVSIVVTTNAGVSNLPTSSSTTSTDASATFTGGTAVAGVVVGNQLQFNNIPVPGTLTNLVISNVRVNASSIPPNTNVLATIAGSNNIIVNNTSGVAVAYTQASVAKPIVAGFASQPICSAGSNVVPILETEIISGFNNSFIPSTNTAGFYLQVNFGGLVSGVNYYVPATISGAANVLNVTSVTNVTDTSGGSPTTTTIGPSSGQQVPTVVQLVVTNGSASALFKINGAAAGVEAFVLPLFAVTTTGATNGTSSAPTVSANLVSPASGYDQFSATQTPTAVSAVNNASSTILALPALNVAGTSVLGGPSATGTGELTSCTTTLLFPYILNTGGYDTGVAITNASQGTNTIAQSGTCSMQFYGNGAPTTNPFVTPTITSGNVTTFTVSSVASGFQGYAVATCNFQNGHGFAFITDGYGQPGRGLSQGYLAIVTGSTVTQTSF